MTGNNASGHLDSLTRARRAADGGDWKSAAAAFQEADRGRNLGVDDLETWATAWYMLGRPAAAAEVHMRIFQMLHDAGEYERAARTSFWIVFLALESGDTAQAGGWMARGQRLLDRMGADGIAQAYLLALRAYQLVAVEGENAEGMAAATQGRELAQASGDRDLEALCLNLEGRALLRSGRVDDGLSVLDEAMVAVLSRELSPVVVGTVYCSLIEACEEVSSLRRAHEWTNSLKGWCERQEGEVPFTAQCRIYRSKIYQRRGDMRQAEQEALWAYELYRQTPYAAATGRASYRLAEIHRVRGDFDAAERRYQEASEWGVDPQPGLALVQLARGKVGSAAAGLSRLLAETTAEVDRVGLLPVYVEVMIAAGDVPSAEAAVSELADLTSTYDTDYLRATTAQTEGMMALVKGDAASALAKLREASAVWQEMGASYELARTRVLIGNGCQLLGDDETAAVEFAAAGRQFQEMGVADVTSWLPIADGGEHGLTGRELEVLQRLATGVTNKEIADDLYLSVKTVDRHVANILAKLGVRSRTAAVSFAYEHGLF